MAATENQPLKRTPLYEAHVAAGGKIVDFAGWEMPVQYAGIREEHLAVRSSVGVFDVSHMGEIETFGPDAPAFLQRILSNDVEQLDIGGAQYSVLCREDGGVLDDLFTYRTGGDRYLTVTNASNHGKDLAWFRRQAEGFDVQVVDSAEATAMLAVQGPLAREVVQALSDQPLPGRFRSGRRRIDGLDMLVAGTGYTGEDGVELIMYAEHAPVVWEALLRRGAQPIGLAARDTLRLEVCYHLYGNDLMESRGPIEAGLGWACKEATGFVGAEAVRAVRAAGPSEKLVAFTVEGKGIARHGNPVVGGGEVTSGTLSPSLGVGIGMAYVPVASAEPGTKLQIDVRGKVRDAVVAPKPLYQR
ncbi:glycine cleavage system aminomethyltransferase GcvT [Paraconexibacter antarcticus]|uniref:Aminomethyltransferase n=1 Tax=Paraconexibacter antarcticus TaxID=2949664 RepID=A0ABY5DMG8_9ACTN|nr:glycine cleavage system aminomethyltransferase GcvT [Paraconexibacter antarcticus]UTI63155.1 glycine cleavage system aminomethyltransferase GcvT [Paraconexibacter antarcticus]